MVLNLKCFLATTEIKLSFESDKYTVNETDGVQNELVSVCKEGGGLTERTLNVLVQLNVLSEIGAATRGSKVINHNTVLKTLISSHLLT